MEIIATALLTTALAGAGVARWTRWHPLLIGPLVAIPVAVLALLVAAGAMSPGALAVGGIAWLIAATAGALGAFLGWLRRKHIKRMN